MTILVAQVQGADTRPLCHCYHGASGIFVAGVGGILLRTVGDCNIVLVAIPGNEDMITL